MTGAERQKEYRSRQAIKDLRIEELEGEVKRLKRLLAEANRVNEGRYSVGEYPGAAR